MPPRTQNGRFTPFRSACCRHFCNEDERRVGSDSPAGLVALQDQPVDAEFGRPRGLVEARRLSENLDAGVVQFADAGGEFGVIAAGEDRMGRLHGCREDEL